MSVKLIAIRMNSVCMYTSPMTTNLFQNEILLDWRWFHEGEVLQVALELCQVRDLTQQRLCQVATKLYLGGEGRYVSTSLCTLYTAILPQDS